MSNGEYSSIQMAVPSLSYILHLLVFGVQAKTVLAASYDADAASFHSVWSCLFVDANCDDI